MQYALKNGVKLLNFIEGLDKKSGIYYYAYAVE